MDAKKSITTLQYFATELTGGALLHRLQGQVFRAQGFTKLADKYISHYNEEMEWVGKFVDRILELGGQVKDEGTKPYEVITDPIVYVRADVPVQKAGVEMLHKSIEPLRDDPITYQIFLEYAADEEEDLCWSKGAVRMMDTIGEQNWLATQI